MRKDPLREYILKVQEAYDVAACPPCCSIYADVQTGDEPPHPETMPIGGGGAKLLAVSIDVKGIVDKFLANLAQTHGAKRAERLTEYIQYGYIREWSYRQREEIRADRGRLSWRVYLYKRRAIQ